VEVLIIILNQTNLWKPPVLISRWFDDDRFIIYYPALTDTLFRLDSTFSFAEMLLRLGIAGAMSK
jgi:hypothetical protein